MVLERIDREPTPPAEPKFFWNGANAVTLHEVKVRSLGAMIPVYYPPDSLPPQDPQMSDQDYLKRVRRLKVATRSRFAQLGLEILQNAGGMFAYDLGSGSETPSRVMATNLGERTLKIPTGTELFAFYEPGDPIIGKELVAAMENDIQITGKEGREWKFVYSNRYDRTSENVSGIAVRIEEGEAYYIPWDTEEIDVSTVANAPDYRAELRKYYEKVPKNHPVGIWFGTLPQVKLSGSVAVELDERIFPSINSSNGARSLAPIDRGPRHIGARLLHPGSGYSRTDNEGWKIKVEIHTRDSAQEPGYVIFRPMRALPEAT